MGLLSMALSAGGGGRETQRGTVSDCRPRLRDTERPSVCPSEAVRTFVVDGLGQRTGGMGQGQDGPQVGKSRASLSYPLAMWSWQVTHSEPQFPIPVKWAQW